MRELCLCGECTHYKSNVRVTDMLINYNSVCTLNNRKHKKVKPADFKCQYFKPIRYVVDIDKIIKIARVNYE